MPDEMEEMEARLAAYIDGTLPPAQRVEIEAYLKSNPTHARLIAELQSIKTAVATLPMEKAPVEVLDTLQAHLERQTLLENVEDAATPMRINRWPQFGAAAAMLALAAGLGVLIYQVLPSGRPAQNDLALLTSSAASRPGEAEAVPNDGVSLSDAAKTAAPGAVAPNAPLAKADSDIGTPATRNRWQALNNVNNYARDETQANNSQSGMAQHQQQQQLGGPMNEAVRSDGVAQDQKLALSKAESMPAALAAATTQSATVNVLLVRTEDPALTANLLIGGLVQENVRFSRVMPASTQPADADAMRDIEDVVASLQLSGDLPAATTTRELLLPARPLLVPAASGETLRTARAALAVPGLGLKGSRVISFSRQPAETSPTTQPNAAFRTEIAPLHGRLVREISADAATTQSAQGYVIAGATTQPFYAESKDRTPPADLYVLIVHETPPAASQPAVLPATAPASQPAMGEMP